MQLVDYLFIAWIILVIFIWFLAMYKDRVRERDNYKYWNDNANKDNDELRELLKKERENKQKQPYEVDQKVMYNDAGFVMVGYISAIKTEQYEFINPDSGDKELVIMHEYEIGSGLYTDIIGVVKEDIK